MGKGDGEVEEGDSASSEEEELETSALYKQEDDVQLVLQASGEKARERFENEVRKICATIQLVVVKIEIENWNWIEIKIQIEKQIEVRNICATIQLVVVARQNTIAKLDFKTNTFF